MLLILPWIQSLHQTRGDSDSVFLTAEEVERLGKAADHLASRPRNAGHRTDIHGPAEPVDIPTDDNGIPQIPDSPLSTNGLIIRLLAYTGLRFGELAALQVKSVDLTNCHLKVAASAVEVNGKMVVGDTKTHQQRSVPFPKRFADPLRKQIGKRHTNAILFPNTVGTHLRVRVWSRRYLAAAVRISGIPENVTAHDLRHTAASLAISNGMHVKSVQRLLGHASASMTLDVYAGLFPEDLRAIGD